MLTYEDLVKVGEDQRDRINFVGQAIAEHRSSQDYNTALAAQAYYDGENPTIMHYEKLLYDMAGRAHVDMWTANHKIASSFFTFVVDQEVSYLLGNGVRFSDTQTSKKLGKDFDQEVMDALEYARIAGASYGLWDNDHLVVFKLTEFKPLYAEDTGELKAGIRFWQLAEDKPLRATLYELDGYTEYSQEKGKEMIVAQEKRPYKIRTTGTKAEGEISSDGENYDGFPIVPLYSNKAHKSALNGHRNTIDALDLATSSMVNSVDEGALIYWVLTNCGGMDEIDDAKFIERIKTSHVAHADGDSGATAEAHTVEAPFEGTKVTVDMLRDQLYDDFQAFDAKSMTAADMSATAIKAGYSRLDMKSDKIERQVTRFINGILSLAGIDDNPTYQRNQMINATEETTRVLQQAEYFDEEYITKKLLAINGDVDMYDEIMKRKDADDMKRLKDLEAKLLAVEKDNAEVNPSAEREEENATDNQS